MQTQFTEERWFIYNQWSRIYYYRTEKTLEKMVSLSLKRLNNLVTIIVGIIISKTVVLSEIVQELKDSYSSGT